MGRLQEQGLTSWILPIFLIGCCLVVDQCQSQGITFIGPKAIHPFRDYTAIICNTLGKDATFEVQLHSDSGTSKQNLKVRKNSLRPVTFAVNNARDETYALEITSLDPMITFNHEIDLQFNNKSMSTFIQTDKPVYKPGDVINFRVVSVYENTKPVVDNTTIKVSLTDGEENSIRSYPFARLINGIFESKVQLAASPLLGNWTLQVDTGEETITKHILVKEYVLPIFYVKVTAPDIQLAHTKTITVTIESRYTFDKDVNGNATVALYLQGKSKPDQVQKFDMLGRKTITFTLAAPIEIGHNELYKSVQIVATMMEAFTNRTANITEYIPIYEHPYQIKVTKTMPRFWPGKPYKVQISVEKHNGMVVEERKNIKLTLDYEGDENEETIVENRKLSVVGSISVELNPPEWANSVKFSAEYDSIDYDNFYQIKAARTESNQFIRVFVSPKNRIRVGKDITFTVQCSEAPRMVFYIVLSKGNLVQYNVIHSDKRTHFNQKLRLTPSMVPMAKLVVFYHRENYLLYDDVDLVFENLENDLTLNIDSNLYLPGQDIVIDVDATEDSFVILQGIDESALDLGNGGHDLTKHGIISELLRYGVVDQENELDYFGTMNLFLKTTSHVDGAFSRSSLARIDLSALNNDERRQIAHIRTVFPESWLWKTISMDGPTLQHVDTVPDTITSWQISGFALSPSTGLGIISHPINFVVRQQFYVVGNLPYSIKRGEVALIQVTVFNFLGYSVSPNVTLFNRNDEIEFVDQSSTDDSRRTKPVSVPDNNGKQISFMVKAKKLGQIAIKVEAMVSPSLSDSLERMLRVTPESRKYEKNEARFIQQSKQEIKTMDIRLEVPNEIDEGSVAITFSLDSDLLGTPIQNLENLIRMPTGCGEQKMAIHVPNIVILDYLSAVNNQQIAILDKARNFLANGYQVQLSFKRSDGSFSSWGRSDAKGSVFLTAFVATQLKIASKYISVDPSVVSNALHWLAARQKSTGQFTEDGTVFYHALQGGSTNYALTAFVLVAFLENKELTQHRNVIQQSVNYLEQNFEQMTDAYDLALATYALSLQLHPRRKAFLDKLVENSIFDGNTTERYWNKGSASIEVAGYALMSYVLQDQILDGTPLMRWLNRHRQPWGGFGSTQSTFVALKALAAFAAKTSKERNNYRVRIIYEPNGRQSFDIDRTHSLKVENFALPSHLRKLKVEIEGTGNGVFQIAYQYYRNIDHERDFSFNLGVVMLNTTTYDVQQLQICVDYKPKEAYQRSNMVLVEVFLPSGLMAYTDAIKDLSNGEIKKTELHFGGTSVAVYYDNLGTDTKCFEVTAYRKYKIAQHLPAYVVVYDYYEKDRFAIKSYEGKVMQLCDICEDEDCSTLRCE